MKIKVRCMLCLEKRIETNQESQDGLTDEEIIAKEPFNLQSKLIAKNMAEEMSFLGQELVAHMQACHSDKLQLMAQLSPIFNGFNVVKYFESESPDDPFEVEKEASRDRLVEEIMTFAPEDEEEEDESETSHEFDEIGTDLMNQMEEEKTNA